MFSAAAAAEAEAADTPGYSEAAVAPSPNIDDVSWHHPLLPPCYLLTNRLLSSWFFAPLAHVSVCIVEVVALSCRLGPSGSRGTRK